MVEKQAPSKNLQSSLAKIQKESGNLSNVGDLTIQAVSKVLV
jgi:hypothetical protein